MGGPPGAAGYAAEYERRGAAVDSGRFTKEDRDFVLANPQLYRAETVEMASAATDTKRMAVEKAMSDLAAGVHSREAAQYVISNRQDFPPDYYAAALNAYPDVAPDRAFKKGVAQPQVIGPPQQVPVGEQEARWSFTPTTQREAWRAETGGMYATREGAQLGDVRAQAQRYGMSLRDYQALVRDAGGDKEVLQAYLDARRGSVAGTGRTVGIDPSGRPIRAGQPTITGAREYVTGQRAAQAEREVAARKAEAETKLTTAKGEAETRRAEAEYLQVLYPRIGDIVKGYSPTTQKLIADATLGGWTENDMVELEKARRAGDTANLERLQSQFGQAVLEGQRRRAEAIAQGRAAGKPTGEEPLGSLGRVGSEE